MLKFIGFFACLAVAASFAECAWNFAPLTQGDPPYVFEPAGFETCVDFGDRCVRSMACAFQESTKPIAMFACGSGANDSAAEKSNRAFLVDLASFHNQTVCNGALRFPFSPELLAITLTSYQSGVWFQIEYPFRARPCKSAEECLAAIVWVSEETGWAGLVPPCGRMIGAECARVE